MTEPKQEVEEVIPIGNLCRDLGISTRTLRYWEEVGIIESVDRADRSNRGYTPYMVRRIKFILKLRDLGLTIKEMQHLYKVYGDAKKTEHLIPELISIIDQHVKTIDEKVAQMSILRNEIIEYRQRMLIKLEQSRQKELSDSEPSAD